MYFLVVESSMSVNWDSLSTFEKSELQKIASNEYYPTKSFALDDVVYFGASVSWLFLVLDGERPACDFCFSVVSDDFLLDNYPFVDLLYSLPLRFDCKIENKYDDEGVNKLFFDMTVYNDVEGDEWFHGLMKSEDKYDEMDRKLGQMLGYPESVIDAFLAGESVGLEQIVSKYNFSKYELRYLEYIPYLVPDDRVLIQEAVELGIERDSRLRELDNEYWFLDGLSWWADRTLEQGLLGVEQAIDVRTE